VSAAEQLAREVRRLLDEGQYARVAQLVDELGPCDWPADLDGTASLGAEALERHADELAGRDPAAARAACLRAAAAQRSFAAYASSGSEGSARMAEPARLEAKAELR
jgi:hypothetical protein